MSEFLLDPTAVLAPANRQLIPRLQSLKGATIGLLDIPSPEARSFWMRSKTFCLTKEQK